MQFFTLKPEVPGQIGHDTELDTSVHPPRIVDDKLHLAFDGFLGSSLIKVSPAFCVSQELKADIERAGLTGCSFDVVKITKSQLFHDIYPDGKDLPEFVWLKLEGVAGKDDFGRSESYRIVVSERALNLIKTHPLEECDIEPYRE